MDVGLTSSCRPSFLRCDRGVGAGVAQVGRHDDGGAAAVRGGGRGGGDVERAPAAPAAPHAAHQPGDGVAGHHPARGAGRPARRSAVSGGINAVSRRCRSTLWR